MKINISYNPAEEARVLRITELVKRLFPASVVKTVQKEKYKHCYIETTKNRT